MVKFRQLHLHFLPLEQVILCLLTDWRDEIKLSGHWVGLLEGDHHHSEAEVKGHEEARGTVPDHVSMPSICLFLSLPLFFPHHLNPPCLPPSSSLSPYLPPPCFCPPTSPPPSLPSLFIPPSFPSLPRLIPPSSPSPSLNSQTAQFWGPLYPVLSWVFFLPVQWF